MDAFLEANRQSGGDADYELCLVATSANRMVRAGGAFLLADASIFDEDRHIDTLLIVGTPDYSLAFESADLHSWLRRRMTLTRRCGSVGTGAFFLGAAGLLDGMNATTHWQYTAELAARCPAARILPGHTFVEDGTLYTSAGVTAGIDLALKLIEEDHGRKLARKVARSLVASFQRPGGRSQFSARLTAQSVNEDRIRVVQNWILDHLPLDLTLDSLAARAAMGVRHFARIFQRETGTTPRDFVEIARVNAAQRLLENSDMLLHQVATRCGFANTDVMRRAFLRRLGTVPSSYLKKRRI
jgi:transcriptional regulator GlxA family with amidase domain